MQYYAVLPDGLQQISPVLAAILRNNNSYGLQQPPRLGADEVAKLPVSRVLDTRRYPSEPVSLVDVTRDPVTCAYWSKPVGAATSSLTLLAGSALPVPDAVHTVELVGAGNGGVATRVALAAGTGYFTQTVGGGPDAPGAGSLFWVSDTGVRYGIDNEPQGVAGGGKAVEALGLNRPRSPSRGRCCRCLCPARRCRVPTRCWHTTPWCPTAGPLVRYRPREGTGEQTDL